MANPPVVKNITRKPKKETTIAITPCRLIHANVTADSPNEPIIPKPPAISKIMTSVPPTTIANVTFQGTTTNIWYGIQTGQQHSTLPRSSIEVNRKQNGLYARKLKGNRYQNHWTSGVYSLNLGWQLAFLSACIDESLSFVPNWLALVKASSKSLIEFLFRQYFEAHLLVPVSNPYYTKSPTSIPIF